jgi:hypothetical protein
MLDRPMRAEIGLGPATIPDATRSRAAVTPPAGFWGGEYTTRTNEHVAVYTSPSYAVDQAANQRWADFLAGLVHGTELSGLTLVLAPPADVTALCGNSDSLGCYANGRIVGPGEDTPDVSAESVITHEYGHHVAGNRENPPWRAIAWGTKRWASYVQVCRRTRAHELFPGAEGPLLYQFNPGEVFAETYRVLNQRRAGVPETPWEIVDATLRPDDRGLALAEQDVVDPWSSNRTSTLSGRFTRSGSSARSFRFATPLDGTFTAAVRAATRLRVEIISGGKRVARATTSVQTTVCGARTLTVRVTRVAGEGPFELVVSRP